jgi:hypothetical protein
MPGVDSVGKNRFKMVNMPVKLGNRMTSDFTFQFDKIRNYIRCSAAGDETNIGS